MSKIVLGLMAVMLGLSAASAADFPYKAPPYRAAVVSPAYNWSGFYAGLNGGGAWADVGTTQNSITTQGQLFGLAAHSFPSTQFNGADSSGKMTGGFGGVQLGYNYQFGNIVAGIETDFDGASLKDSGSFLGSAAGPTYSTKQSIQWFGSTRGHLGYAVNNLLFYGTGGVAYAGAKAELGVRGGTPAHPVGSAFSASDMQTLVGGVYGGGVEWAFAPSWTVKAEYLYYDFGHQKFGAGIGDGSFATDAHVTMQTARVGLNYKLPSF